MLLKHSMALIELLSLLSDEVLVDLGMTETEIDSLDEVFGFACDHYKAVVGLEHPTESRGGEVDPGVPHIIVVPADGDLN